MRSRQASVSCVGLTAPVLILRDASAKCKPARSSKGWLCAMSALTSDNANCRRVNSHFFPFPDVARDQQQSTLLHLTCSSTRTQSPSPGGVNCRFPSVVASPAESHLPVRGLNQDTFARFPANFDISTATVRAVGK